MTGTVLMALAPLPPAVWLRQPRRALPFPLQEPGLRLYARARHALWHGALALGLRAGDEVLVPAYHHGSEIEALLRAGLRCSFYDAGPRLEPDVRELDALLGPHTRALLLIHPLGFPQDAPRWRRWCDRHGLALVEDAAHAWLSSVDGRPVGSFGDAAVFCLYKTFGLPDGGALLCAGADAPNGTADLAGLRLALEHAAWIAGRSNVAGALADRVRPAGRGYDRAADHALGLPRPPSLATRLALSRIADAGAVERRRAHHRQLADALGDAVHPVFARLPSGACPLVLPVADADKPGLLRALRAEGIRALDLWSVPHPALPAGAFPHAERLRRSLVGLPVHPELRPADVERIAAAVQRRSRPLAREPERSAA